MAFDTLGTKKKVHNFFYRTPASFLAQDGHACVIRVCRVKKTTICTALLLLEKVWKACTVCS